MSEENPTPAETAPAAPKKARATSSATSGSSATSRSKSASGKSTASKPAAKKPTPKKSVDAAAAPVEPTAQLATPLAQSAPVDAEASRNAAPAVDAAPAPETPAAPAPEAAPADAPAAAALAAPAAAASSGDGQLPPPPAAGTQAAPAAGPLPMLERDARMWAMLLHILSAVAVVLSAGTLAFIVPLIVWLIYRDRSALIDWHGKQNLNLQLTTLIVVLGGGLIGLVTLGIGLLLTIPLMLAYSLYAIIIAIVAGVKANNGEYYRIPLVFTLIK